MHREISHTDPAFHQESHLSLYLMTGLLGVLLLLDLCLPDIGGYRIALVAAVLGGAARFGRCCGRGWISARLACSARAAATQGRSEVLTEGLA